MTPAEIARLLRTVRHLRPIQIVGQLRRRIHLGHRPRRALGDAPHLRSGASHAVFLPAAPHAQESSSRRVVLLNRALDLGAQVDWDNADLGPLWQFHLHYHDWLRAPRVAPAERAALLRDWIERHQEGVGWHPATISLRVFVWTKLFLSPDLLPRDPVLAAALAASLADQLATLIQTVTSQSSPTPRSASRLIRRPSRRTRCGSEWARSARGRPGSSTPSGERTGSGGGRASRGSASHLPTRRRPPAVAGRARRSRCEDASPCATVCSRSQIGSEGRPPG